MMKKNEKKKIINELNTLFSNYDELSRLCNELSNNFDTVIEYINKIIKYFFVEKNMGHHHSLWSLVYSVDEADELYKVYLNKKEKHHLLRFIKRKPKQKNKNLSILDNVIDINDVEGLILPSIEDIRTICNTNIQKQAEYEEKVRQKNKYYQEQKGFEEIAFTYDRIEPITIDASFIYYNATLSGNIDEDYIQLYQDERYHKNKQSPLNKTYEENIKEIKRSSDIILRKLGNIYELCNGRHRIIYILKQRESVTIYVKMIRRFEDQETNIILNILKNKYNIIIYKNNIFNDEQNLVIIFNGTLYEIKNKKELKEFYNNLENNKPNISYKKTEFDILDKTNTSKTMNKYQNIIFKKYLEFGDIIITSNYTDVLKYFPEGNNQIFYDAFNLLQKEYQESLVFQYDFNKRYMMLRTYTETIEAKDYKKRK